MTQQYKIKKKKNLTNHLPKSGSHLQNEKTNNDGAKNQIKITK